jgi:hypothetical protein
MGRNWIIAFIRTLITCLFFTNILSGQTSPKPLFEKYGDSLSVFLFQDYDLLKAAKFIEKIDEKIEEEASDGLGVYYYYKSIYLKQISNNKYKKLLLKSLEELNKSDNYFIYQILVSEQISRLNRDNKDFVKELFYLSNAFNLIKKHKDDIAITISNMVVKSYFYSLLENNKSDQAIQDAEWIDILSANDTTRILCYSNVSYLLSQKGAIREQKIIDKKIFTLFKDRSDLNQFFISCLNSYAYSLKQTGFKKDGENLFLNNIKKIESEFEDKKKIDFYLRYAYYVKDEKTKLQEVTSILEEKRFRKLLEDDKSFSNRFKELEDSPNQYGNSNIIDILEHEVAIEQIVKENIHETKLIYHYSELSILYAKVSDTDKSKAIFNKLKSVFSNNKTTLNRLDLSSVTKAAIYFEDIKFALESWKFRLEWINNSICLNNSFINEEFEVFFKMERLIVFHAKGFNLKYGNFPELQKKIIVFHDLMKRRVIQETEFNNELKLLNLSSEHNEKLKEYMSLNNTLVITTKEKERLLYLKRYFSELIDPSANKVCQELDVDSYRNSKSTILYYTSIEADGAEFYSLYTLNNNSNLNPLNFYYDLDKKPSRALNDEFTKLQIKHLRDLNIRNSNEILISRTADLNFVNFSAYNNEIDSLTGTKTKIRLINTLEEIDDLTDEEFSQDTEIILYGDVDFDNYKGKISESINSKVEVTSLLADNLSRSSLSSWPYLPGTLKEINLINDLAKTKNIKSIINDGINASETRLRSLSKKQNPFILHLATHGFFFDKVNSKSLPNSYVSNDDPLIRSGIVLAGANRVWGVNPNELSDNDGVLTSKEIVTLDLKNCKLLVLSACDTGLGVFGTDSVEGIQKAFKIAGVDKIIMSLSKISDAKTPIFFEYFYSELFKGTTIHTAFSNTQKEMRKRYGFEDDFWSSFILLE